MGKVGSANAPTATPIISGRAWGCQYTVDPQAGQKCMVLVFPLSATRPYSLDAPFTLTASRGYIATRPKADPVRLWQSRQLQSETTSGSPSQVAVRPPHWQVAVRVVIPYPFSVQARDKASGP